MQAPCPVESRRGRGRGRGASYQRHIEGGKEGEKFHGRRPDRKDGGRLRDSGGKRKEPVFDMSYFREAIFPLLDRFGFSEERMEELVRQNNFDPKQIEIAVDRVLDESRHAENSDWQVHETKNRRRQRHQEQRDKEVEMQASQAYIEPAARGRRGGPRRRGGTGRGRGTPREAIPHNKLHGHPASMDGCGRGGGPTGGRTTTTSDTGGWVSPVPSGNHPGARKDIGPVTGELHDWGYSGEIARERAAGSTPCAALGKASIESNCARAATYTKQDGKSQGDRDDATTVELKTTGEARDLPEGSAWGRAKAGKQGEALQEALEASHADGMAVSDKIARPEAGRSPTPPSTSPGVLLDSDSNPAACSAPVIIPSSTAKMGGFGDLSVLTRSNPQQRHNLDPPTASTTDHAPDAPTVKPAEPTHPPPGMASTSAASQAPEAVVPSHDASPTAVKTHLQSAGSLLSHLATVTSTRVPQNRVRPRAEESAAFSSPEVAAPHGLPQYPVVKGNMPGSDAPALDKEEWSSSDDRGRQLLPGAMAGEGVANQASAVLYSNQPLLQTAYNSYMGYNPQMYLPQMLPQGGYHPGYGPGPHAPQSLQMTRQVQGTYRQDSNEDHGEAGAPPPPGMQSKHQASAFPGATGGGSAANSQETRLPRVPGWEQDESHHQMYPQANEHRGVSDRNEGVQGSAQTYYHRSNPTHSAQGARSHPTAQPVDLFHFNPYDRYPQAYVPQQPHYAAAQNTFSNTYTQQNPLDPMYTFGSERYEENGQAARAAQYPFPGYGRYGEVDGLRGYEQAPSGPQFASGYGGQQMSQAPSPRPRNQQATQHPSGDRLTQQPQPQALFRAANPSRAQMPSQAQPQWTS